MLRYQLEKLGWFQFERLIKALLKAEIGIAVESWGRYKDYGIDAFYQGELNFPNKEKSTKGTFIFQIKFSEQTVKKQQLKSLKAAIKKSQKGLSKFSKLEETNQIFYTLITNIPLTVKEREHIRDLIHTSLSVDNKKTILIMDGEDVCAMLDNHKDIRWNYPQLLSIQDIDYFLTSILNKKIIEKSDSLLEEAKENLIAFVPTHSYYQAINILKQYNFVVLEGPPEVGKTTTAYAILLNSVMDGWDVYDCSSPEEFFSVYSKNKNQLFFADDAFGDVNYRPDIANRWGRELNKIINKLDDSHWFIWTSRAHILKAALEDMHLKGKAEKFPSPGDLVIDVGNFSREEKALILYRHAKSANLEDEAKKIIKSHWKLIIDNKYFTPLRAKYFVRETLSHILKESKHLNNNELVNIIIGEIETPTSPMKKSFKKISEEYKCMLFAMLDVSQLLLGFNRNRFPLSELEKAFNRHCRKANRNFQEIVDHLDYAFIRKTGTEIGWVHPSIKDLVIEELSSDFEKKIKFIEASGLEGIFLLLSTRRNGSWVFLNDKESWDILSKQVDKILQNENNLLNIERFLDILIDMKEDADTRNNLFDSYKKLILIVLNHLKRIFEKSKVLEMWIPRISLIKKFYELFLVIYPEYPSLDWNIWIKYLERKSKEKLNEFNNITYIKLLIGLASVFHEYDMITFKVLKLPQRVENIFVKYLKKIEDEIGYDYCSDNEYDSLMEDAEYWQEVVEFMEVALEVFPQYEKKITPLINEAESISACCEHKAWEVEDNEENTIENEHTEKTYSFPLPENNIKVDLNKIFDDL